jgi:hypothetical protein
MTIAASITLTTVEEQRSDVSWWPILRGYNREDLMDSSSFFSSVWYETPLLNGKQRFSLE